ncbi:WSCD family member CG9164-like [Mytilus californianus]|uniref:WSCD family member CG9164-like n=1 Tax=Mytilus californianus TaxID=6549 RepID=UPI0022469A66|nr:WSCD family member CG9164-like [Mytilus californianus]
MWIKHPTEMNCSQTTIKMSKEKRPVTALFSFPGSGNTWTRHLIEYTSGVATGSVYCATSLIPVFIGECHVKDVIVIKSHEGNNRVKFEKAIVLIRSPYRSIISFFNYRYSRGHNQTGFASKDDFERLFEGFAITNIQQWRGNNLGWLQFKGPKCVVFYEELLQNTVSELKKMNNFLNVTVADTTYSCLLKNIEGDYHRSYKSLTFNPMQYYTRKLNVTIENAIKQVEEKVAYVTGNNHNIKRFTSVLK